MKPMKNDLPGIHLASCESTNDVARKEAEMGAPHGFWVMADHQLAGRGRAGRQWVSESSNLSLSVILRPPQQKWISWIPLAASVGLVEAIQGEIPGCPVKLKWPNDLMIGDKKLGGVLCEGFSLGGKSLVIVGMGVNVGFAPQIVGRLTTALCLETTHPPEINRLRDRVVVSVLRWCDRAGGGVKEKFWALSTIQEGCRIRWEKAGVSFEGVAVSLGSHGQLLVRLATGEIQDLYSEEVHLLGG